MTVEITSNSPVAQAQTYRVEVSQQAVFANDQESLPAIRHLGVNDITACRKTRLFFLYGQLTPADVDRISRELLVDPVTETFTVLDEGASQPEADHVIEVTLIPGVTDPVAENLVRAAHLLDITGLERVATGQHYLLWGSANAAELQAIATGVFANPVIQRFVTDEPIEAPFVLVQAADSTVETIPVRTADDAGLLAVSSERRLALDLAEMRAIRTYYQQEERDPTDVELETLAQTWSEHCVHKTFRAKITCRVEPCASHTGGSVSSAELADGVQRTQVINGLLRTYIRGATERINKPWVRSAFVDNAGVIAFDDTWDLAFKVETHNHPSALEPFGGAHTGVGGVVRDILGISARPIANTDVLCFGPPDLPETELPAGVLHPQRIAAGVTHGVEDYGNKMGIPTVNGAILYHRGYTSNPLVFCGCLGLLPRDSHPTAAQPGDLIIVIGGRTGRDGIRGATFSSMEMDQTTSAVAGSSVQIGHPIQEKQVLEVVLQARDARLYHAITDCGAGGLASAVGEMGSKLGAEVDLAAAPLKYPGLRPWEIWLSEAQERMVLAVAPAEWAQLQEICTGQNVEAVCIGSFEATDRLRLQYGDQVVADLSMTFLHEGIPQRVMEADIPTYPTLTLPKREGTVTGSNLGETLLALLAHPNIRSKEAIIHRYDHEVQGGTTVKPLVGVANHGPSDAAVIVPLGTVNNKQSSVVSGKASAKGIRGAALSVGICPQYGELDPYRMAWAAIDEALRNAVCVGADPDQVALLDNFCWGKPTLPDRLGSLVRCAQGCYDAAVAYGAPFISGKDSLNNEYLGADGRTHAIPGTLLISALGIVPDVQRTVTMDLKKAGNLLYLVGETHAELGGSHYQGVHGTGDGAVNVVPQPVANPLDRLRALHRAIRTSLVRACHDCSEGGLGVALAEMCLAGRLGATVDLRLAPGTATDDALLLFSESLGRFVVEVRPGDAKAFEAQLTGVPYARIGAVGTEGLQVQGLDGQLVVETNVSDLERAWRGSLAPTHVEQTAPVLSPPATRPAQEPSERAKHGVTTSKPRVLIMHANGTNRDREAALACELAGAIPDIVHINQLLAGERRLVDYAMLVLPGGFSYGDDLGAGALWALDLHQRLGEDLTHFAASKRPILGICNGFQALVKTGLLPGGQPSATRTATLTNNASGHFECRWVYLQPNPASPCVFTQGLNELIYCPVAHGEGRFISDAAQLDSGLVALTYVDTTDAAVSYPANPNGSILNIAGICNATGNILGLMPHPEDHVFFWQHPRWRRGEAGLIGLRLFEQGIRYAQC